MINFSACLQPVINVFPVPDAAGLICVTLGQLEIKEVRWIQHTHHQTFQHVLKYFQLIVFKPSAGQIKLYLNYNIEH